MIKSVLKSVIAGTFLWLASHSVRLGIENFRPCTLTVKGIAERKGKAEFAEITITVYDTDDSLEGLSKSLDTSKKKVLNFLKRYGFDPKKVTEGMGLILMIALPIRMAMASIAAKDKSAKPA